MWLCMLLIPRVQSQYLHHSEQDVLQSDLHSNLCHTCTTSLTCNETSICCVQPCTADRIYSRECCIRLHRLFQSSEICARQRHCVKSKDNNKGVWHDATECYHHGRRGCAAGRYQPPAADAAASPACFLHSFCHQHCRYFSGSCFTQLLLLQQLEG